MMLYFLYDNMDNMDQPIFLINVGLESYLNYFDCEEEAEGEGNKNHEEGEEGDEESTDTRSIIQFSFKTRVTIILTG